VWSFSRRTQARLAFVFSLLFLAVAGAAAAAFWTFESGSEYATVDQALHRQARVVRTIVARAHDDSTIPSLPPGPAGTGIDSYVLDGSGRLLAHGPAGVERGPVIAFATRRGFPASAQVVTTPINGTDLRILVRVLPLPDGSNGGLIVVRSLQDLRGRLNRIAILLLGGVLAAQVAVSLLAWRLAGLALVPIREISAAARDIGEGDLHRRLKTDVPPDDALGELVITFNAMLGRLESYVENQQRFIADAAHELRTPVASAQGIAQTITHLRGRLAPAQQIELENAMAQSTDRLASLVEQLLDLSRLDADAIPIEPEPFDVRTRIEELVAVAGDPRSEGIRIECAPGLQAVADRAAFDRIVSNLIANALRYGEAPIVVRAERTDRHFRIAVEDKGPGVEPDFVPDLFERFSRSNVTRERAGGTGLGLAIARSYAQAHRGNLVYEDAEPHGARFQLVLPAA